MPELSKERVEQRQKNFLKACQSFQNLGGKIINGHPVVDSQVHQTEKGTFYLKAPGVALFSKPQVEISVLQGFLDGFDKSLCFSDYPKDPVSLEGGTQLAKAAGQICYMAFDRERTLNQNADYYIENIKESGHGSVLEHVSFSYLLYGLSRSQTHEHVRHRAGVAISQESQRYVGGIKLRFVERPEYQGEPQLHPRFERRIDFLSTEYEQLTDYLEKLQLRNDRQVLAGDTKTDRRKKVRQASRSALPNETEAPMIWSANVRSLQNIFMMRGSEHAEVEIRELIHRIFLCSIITDPILFSDIELVDLPDGTCGLTSPYKKP